MCFGIALLAWKASAKAGHRPLQPSSLIVVCQDSVQIWRLPVQATNLHMELDMVMIYNGWSQPSSS
jgi:hypothetical protein